MPGKPQTTAEFVKKAINEHGDKYNYANTTYVNKETKLTYICPVHGEVLQKPYLHLKSGCPFCAGRGIGKHTKETFIKRAREIHGDFYDYSKIEFKGIHDKIIIGCPVHGEFIQKAANHINLKNGCPKCKGGVSYDNNDFVELAKSLHNDKFDYSKVDYKKAHSKIIIKCSVHGEFEQMPYVHLTSKYACPSCVAELTRSQGEEEIKSFIEQYFTGEIKQGDRNILYYREIDIYLPAIKLGIEYHGMYWHTEEVVGEKRHFAKANMADKKGIKLIQIYENEWLNKQEIVKSRLKNMLRANESIYARKCKIEEIQSIEKNIFLNRTHLQGMCNSPICYGLKYDGKLVAVMTFSSSRFNSNYDYELVRYSSELGINVVGGAGKLLSHFCKNYPGKSLISYADRRWSSGNLYKKLGFKLDVITDPGYIYYNTKNKNVHSRLKFQKHKLKNLASYSDDLSAWQIMHLEGYRRIWDAGQLRFVKG